MSDQQFAPTRSLGFTGLSEPPENANNSAPRVLVVDDDPGIQLLMRETLAESGFQVSVATSGPEAIDICPVFVPDLMLLDINMPGMDGIAACAEIRKRRGQDFPIVMVTSVDDAVSIQRAFDAGATDFILKPVNWPLFQRRLDSVLAEWNNSQKLDESNNRVRLLEKIAPEQVLLVSRSGNIIEDLKNHPEARRKNTETLCQTLENMFGTDVAARFRQRISGVLKTRHHNNLEFSITEQGISRDCEAQFLVDGRDRVIIVVQNASAEKETQREIYDLAFYDPVTELPNRHLFERWANEMLIDADLHERPLVFISLCFENISNEDLANCDIMQIVATRLRDCLANCDFIPQRGKNNDAAQISRIDSNQFMLTLDNIQTQDDVRTVCGRIAQTFSDQVVVGTGSIVISPRLGVALCPTDGADLQALMRSAEAAMHEACETGERVCFNSQVATMQSVGTLDYRNELQQAMADGQLELHYQPRMAIPDGEITCVEALLRWNHPMRGFVDPGELLQLAKSTALIVPLGNWVLQTACEEAQRWQHVPAPRVSVNLSHQEFARQDLANCVIEILEQTGLDPARVDLELTEAALLRSKNGLADLVALKSLGVGLVLDDFGTGHSSLANLKQYPIDALKIDGSFVRELPGNDEDAAVCEVIITMAHKLGMKAVAEGVETEEQLAFLQERGCDEFQGYHICRPLPSEEVEVFLNHPGRSDQ